MSFGVSVQEHTPEEHITKDTPQTPETPQGAAVWYLEGYADERKVLRRIPVRPLPFQLGRKSGLPLSLNFANISRVHAELYFEDNVLMVKDLESRNGTFINRDRIYRPTPLRAGDVVHFGNVEFRIGREDLHSSGEFGDTMDFQGILPEDFVTGTREFLELIRTEAVCSFFQPLVHISDHRLFGYEALGRGACEGLAENPYDLFKIAASVGLEEELSRLFRRKAVEAAANMMGTPYIFLNIHPGEMKDVKVLMSSLENSRRRYPHLTLTLEIHESLITDLQSMRSLAHDLRKMGCLLAYDDFGAGQARLVELADAPPDFLKFDRSLVKDLHKAPGQRQQMVEVLVRFAKDVGVTTLAEGIELQEEATVCEEIGFECAQGFFFGRPVAIEDLLPTQAK